MTTQLTGNHLIQVYSLPAISGEEEDDVENVRLALLYHGESPADEGRVREILDMDLDDYIAYLAPMSEQKHDYADISYPADKTAMFTTHDDKVVTIRGLKGRDLRRFTQAGATGGKQMLSEVRRLTGLSTDDVKAMHIGDIQAALTAIAFLVSRALEGESISDWQFNSQPTE